MNSDFDIKHKKLRLVLFILALAVAVGAFTFGVYKITNKEPGIYTISASAPSDGETMTYANGFHLQYSFSGSSNDIKDQMKLIQDVYSKALERAYKLTDAEHEYANYTNLATINTGLLLNGGVWTGKPGDELYSILADAYARMEEGDGYSMFAGALWSEWESILVLNDPEDFDPLNDPEELERIREIAQNTAVSGNFYIGVGETDDEVTIAVNEAYFDLLEELEADMNVLSLGALREAYMLELTARALIRAGYAEGMLYTDSGLSAMLGDRMGTEYTLYTLNESGTEAATASEFVEGCSTCALFRAYPASENLYRGYIIDSEGQRYYRHEYFSLTDGAFRDVILSSLVILPETGPVEAAYFNYVLNTLETQEEVEEKIAELASSGVTVRVTYQK